MKTPNRICIYPKDIVRLTGKSERYGRNLIEKIREKNAKQDHHFVTIKEFCVYTGIDLNEVLANLSF